MPTDAMKIESTMLIDVGSARLLLGKGQHVRLRGAFQTRLTCVSGRAWITCEGDADDVVISPGDSFVVPPEKTVLIGPSGGPVTLEARGAPGWVERGVQSDSVAVAQSRHWPNLARKLASYG